MAYQALRLDPSSARVRCVLACALLVKGELRSGREELEKVVRLNSGSLAYLEMAGWLLALLGEWEQGIALARNAVQRNPHHLSHVYHGLWADHLRRGELEDAYRVALECREPLYFWRSLMRASCLGLLGRTDEAGRAAAELLREKPTFRDRGRVLIGHYLKPPELQDRVAEGLRRAGLELA
jgi:tetratricopeptide (TPR) repeat protein